MDRADSHHRKGGREGPRRELRRGSQNASRPDVGRGWEGEARVDESFDHVGRVSTATGPTGTTEYCCDDRARLVRAQAQTATSCLTRECTFAGESKRTSLTRYWSAGDGGCQTDTAASITSYGYDQADWITGGYVYDQMGRTTTLPKRDTSQAGVSGTWDATLSYFANDMVATVASPGGREQGL